ncbi:MAG: PilN domain-containing protein [Fimbriimonas ginsengisoli]|uniref:PilN domain-containing protein n=1 Tax=Fimbriimonas ginsengisoli TaxID=1005039 RepID=A0A931PWI8_FIMGI|nr:PilN domain-containing protein [Fimbriimonas ginsengisoli]
MVQPASLLVEWSPTRVTVYDPTTGVRREGPSLKPIAPEWGSGRRVRVALARQMVFLRSVRVPDAPKAQAMAVVRLSAGQLFPLPIASLAVDLSLTGDVGAEGRLAVVSAAATSNLRQLARELDEVGWEAIEALPIAYGSAVLARKEGVADCAVVHSEGDGWSVDLVQGGELRASRLLPHGTTSATLEDEVARTYAAAGLRFSPILVTNGFAGGSWARSSLTALAALALPEAADIGVDLEPDEVATARAKATHRKAMMTASALALAAAILLGYAIVSRGAQGAAVRRSQGRNQATLATVRSMVTSEQAKLTDLKSAQAALDRALAPAQKLGDVLTLVANSTPDGVWLTGMGIERSKPLILRGTATRADLVATYLRALEASPRLRDVRLVFANNGTIEQAPVVQFSVSAVAVGNLTLAAPRKGSGKP